MSDFLVNNTPLEDHRDTFGLVVKREDLICPPPGPPFSKTRGVYRHVKSRVESGQKLFGALDTFHSQAGHAVSAACAALGAQCLNFYPVYKADAGKPVRAPQQRSGELGAELVGLPAGRSAILYHTARRLTEERGGYMMPNALKLPETIEETADEVVRTFEAADRHTHKWLSTRPWLISASSGTIAAGVMKGLLRMTSGQVPMLVHLGYNRSPDEARKYIYEKAGDPVERRTRMIIVNEEYAYKDQAKPGVTPPWPCNPWYDLKAFRWWLWHREQDTRIQEAVLWNIG